MSARSGRDRLIEAAFALFDERGFDRTTVDDIAERAGVSRATFFRTFRSKDDVIFPDHDAMLRSVEARLASSTEQTVLLAVSEAVRLVLLHYVEEGDLAVARYELTRSVPALRDREIASTYRYNRVFHRFIQRWLGDGPDAALQAELMAAAVVVAHNHVLRRWLRGQTDDPVAEFDAAMARTIAVFSDRGTPAGTSILLVRTTKDLDTVLPELRAVLDDTP